MLLLADTEVVRVPPQVVDGIAPRRLAQLRQHAVQLERLERRELRRARPQEATGADVGEACQEVLDEVLQSKRKELGLA